MLWYIFKKKEILPKQVYFKYFTYIKCFDQKRRDRTHFFSIAVHQIALAIASFNNLTRRIGMISQKKSSGLLKRMTMLTLSLAFFWQAACATKINNSITMLTIDEAKKMITSMESDLPIEVNEAVLKWLNYYLGNHKGRSYVKKTKSNMIRYEKSIKKELQEKKVPLDLLAIPFMESGFINDSTSINGAKGLWQFMPQTARKYGLKVDHKCDERLDVKKSTLAAIEYYKNLLKIKEFNNDWRLALLAYNAGERTIIKAIEKKGTNNPWAFNNLGDKEYLAKIMAGIILLKTSEES